MASTHALKKQIDGLLRLTGSGDEGKFITPNKHTLILYDIPQWDDSMQSWMQQKAPSCHIRVVAMSESMTGFGVVFTIAPHRTGTAARLLRLGSLLVLLTALGALFSRVHNLAAPAQARLWDAAGTAPPKPPPKPPLQPVSPQQAAPDAQSLGMHPPPSRHAGEPPQPLGAADTVTDALLAPVIEHAFDAATAWLPGAAWFRAAPPAPPPPPPAPTRPRPVPPPVHLEPGGDEPAPPWQR